MIRTVITPLTTNVNVSIPKEYLGKKVEILLFSLDEQGKEILVKKNSIADFSGVLKTNDAKKLRKGRELSPDEFKKKRPLDEVFGIWKDSNISLEKIREKAWRHNR